MLVYKCSHSGDMMLNFQIRQELRIFVLKWITSEKIDSHDT